LCLAAFPYKNKFGAEILIGSQVSEYSGYLFTIDEEQRAQVVVERIDGFGTFTDTISAPDWRIKHAEIFFISLHGGAIDYAALVRRRRRVATQKYLIRFSNLIRFEPAIPFEQIQERLQPRIQHHFIRSSSGRGSRVPPKTWQGLLTVIKELRPESAHELDRLEQLRQLTPEFFDRPGFEVVAHERDAVNLALRMSDFDKNELLNWNPPDHELAPFLQGLQGVTIREDPMVAHDTEVFGDWRRLGRYQVAAVMFQKGGEILTIMNVNRQKVEETLGVDLLYYHHNYESYVMVQYKRMTRENYRELGYRPVGDSYQDELQRMQDIEHILSKTEDQPQFPLVGYRLYSGTFYFKLCPAEILEPASTEMIKGMYIPLDYWELLVNSPAIIGPQGGQRITYENVGRYFNNTLFIQLVQAGWVGSRLIVKDAITDVIQQALRNKRSVMLAIKRPVW